MRDFSAMMFSRDFINSMWDTPMLVMTAQVGFTTAAMRAISPGMETPISTTAAVWSFFQAADGDGHPHLAVLVAGGLEHLELGGEGLGHHLLGGGLAHAAGDAHHGDGELTPVPGGGLLQGLAAVVDQDQGLLPGGHLVVGKGGAGPGLQGGADVAVAVGVLPPDGHEHGPGLGLAAVGEKGGHRGVLIPAEELAPAGFHDLGNFQSHTPLPFISFGEAPDCGPGLFLLCVLPAAAARGARRLRAPQQLRAAPAAAAVGNPRAARPGPRCCRVPR